MANFIKMEDTFSDLKRGVIKRRPSSHL